MKMTMRRVIATALCVYTVVDAQANGTNTRTIIWNSCPEVNELVTASNGIAGVPFDCATITVPLDYTDPSSRDLELALFKVNATRQPALGSLLINFGGPGGTGAENLPVTAAEVAANVGDQWDLVSWDPRGTGRTLPFDCEANVPATNSTSNQKRDIGVLALTNANASDYLLNYGWDYAGAVADLCYNAMNETGEYIGTAFVARDMIQIVDALGEDGLLRYYGWSYGTALGSYVAAMFPERIDRMVLDANINPHDYQAGHYGDFIQDADKAFAGFLQECLLNRDECALAQYTGAENVETMLDAINSALQPLAANASTSNEAWSAYTAVYTLIYGPLYYPAQWPQLATDITMLLNGSAANLLSTPAPSTTAEPYNLGAAWASTGIRASDALWRTNSSEEYLPQVQYQETLSSFDFNLLGFWMSAQWRMDAKERYEGNFSVTTRHPILYVNGEYDPATPLAAAYNASQSFTGSVVLPHSGYGHGIFVNPSACVARYVQAYFRDGVLPEANAHCEPDQGPWQLASGGDQVDSNSTGSNNTSTEPFTGTASHLTVYTGFMFTIGLVTFWNFF